MSGIKACDVDLNSFVKWQSEGAKREVEARIDQEGNLSVTVMDWSNGYTRQSGVRDVCEIRLDAEAVKMAEWGLKSAITVLGVEGVRERLQGGAKRE